MPTGWKLPSKCYNVQGNCHCRRWGSENLYWGCTDRTFKVRHYGYTSDSRHKDNRTNTKLATYVWDKRDEGVEMKKVKWEMWKCLSEKLIIMKDRDLNSLNKRNELNNSCRHRSRQKLAMMKER